VIGIGRLLVGLLVTGIALDGQSLELPDGPALVTVGAVQPGMPAHEWEAVRVFPHRLEEDAPALHRVALFAIRPHLAAMDIGMTIRAVRACVGKHHLGMTPGASHILV